MESDLEVGGVSEFVAAEVVSANYGAVLGVTPALGRWFASETEPAAVISHAVWQNRFGGSANVLGRRIGSEAQSYTIVGVAPAAFTGVFAPYRTDIWVPMRTRPRLAAMLTDRWRRLVMIFGRLRSDATPGQASAELNSLHAQLVVEHGASTGPLPPIVAEPVRGILNPGGRRLASLSASLLLIVVGVVLLIACVNVSQLLLARAVDRQKEIALRAALGASRGTVARQLTVEAALLAGVAAIAGLALGRGILASLPFLRPPASVPIPTELPLDATVLLFAGAVAVVVALLCGLVPMLRMTRADLSRVLQAGFKRATGTGRRTRDVFMVVEMALSVALVAVSALLIQSLLAVQQAPLGFDPSNVFTLQFRLPQPKYPKPEDIARFFKSAVERVRAVPGVESAALVRAVPFSGNGGTISYAVEGRPVDPASPPQALFHIVTPDYFKTMRIPLLKGRDFSDRDDLGSPLVAVINDTFARRAFPDEDPIGKHFTTPQTPGPLTIIGVVGDAKHYTSTEPARAQLYAAHYQVPLIFSSLVARTKGPALAVTNDVRKAIWSVDKDQPMWSVSALEDIVARTQGQARFLALLLGIFAGLALVLAGVGIYGVTSYAVAQRTHEIGIRLALGASGERVLREVVGRGARLTFIALAIGIVGAIGMARLAAAVLFGVTPTDPVALAGAAIVLAVVSLAATFVPARRASRVDPVVALADE
jgi:putative ABC transport system permease protein